MNARELLALIDDCGMIELINRSGRDNGGWIQETILRALRLLAAAEGGEAERSKLVEDLRTEADLCRNETAEDIAELLDDAASSIIAMSSQFKALKDERNGLAARVGELERAQKENDTLRGLLGNSAKPCPYCGLAAEDQAKCARGFPGCARADDQQLSKHFADSYRANRAEAALEEARKALKHQRTALYIVKERQRDGDVCRVSIADIEQGIVQLDAAIDAARSKP